MTERVSYPDRYKNWLPSGYWVDHLTQKFEALAPINNPESGAQRDWISTLGFVAAKLKETNPVGITPITSTDGKREINYSQNCTDSARLKIRLCELLGIDVYGVINKVGDDGHATLIIDFENRFWELANMAGMFSSISSDHRDVQRTDQYTETMQCLLGDIRMADGAYMWRETNGSYAYQLSSGNDVRSQSPIIDQTKGRGMFIMQPSLAYDVMQASSILRHFYEYQEVNPAYFQAAKLTLRSLIPKLSSQKDSVNA